MAAVDTKTDRYVHTHTECTQNKPNTQMETDKVTPQDLLMVIYFALFRCLYLYVSYYVSANFIQLVVPHVQRHPSPTVPLMSFALALLPISLRSPKHWNPVIGVS